MTKRNEQEVLAAFNHMTVGELKGTIEHKTTYDSTGRSSKKIIIEYNIEHKDRWVIIEKHYSQYTSIRLI